MLPLCEPATSASFPPPRRTRLIFDIVD
jgi:hypothetical protein